MDNLDLDETLVLCEGNDPRCKQTVSRWFAVGYQRKEQKQGRKVGMLCTSCAGARDGERLANEMLARESDRKLSRALPH